MRFSLQDIKKHVQRRGNLLTVTLYFLRSGELRQEIERLVAYHEHLLDHPQRAFSPEDARACIGDYRLAHCLIATLSAWYHWQQRDWQVVVQQCGNDVLERLREADIASPVQLRLALFNFVNERYDGFLASQSRDAALEKFTCMYCGLDPLGKPVLAVRDLEYLLALDSDEEAVLVRDTPLAPDAEEVASLYNQWVFEAALFNASEVHFAIDCNAFIKLQESESGKTTTGVGAVVKRLCYLARKFGVYYDLSYDAGSMAGQVPPSVLHLTLYGPQEMTGTPQQYGLRLARLYRLLLGYSAQSQSRRQIHATSTTLPTSAILQAEATVHFLQRAYHFVMNDALLNLLPAPTRTMTGDSQSPSTVAGSQTYDQRLREMSQPYAIASSVFDSGIEQSFAEAFISLARSDGADGWHLEREPEPLLLPHPTTGAATSAVTSTIFIPDFAFTRDNQRIYLEILGFWTPSYRERKIAKLQMLKGRNDLVLAIPREAAEAFASIAHDFPIVFYRNQLSATEVLHVLRSQYDDVAVRLSRIDVQDVRKQIQSESLVPERACYSLLHCYRRSELMQAADLISGEGVAFAPGIGFYVVDALEQLRVSFVEWLEQSLSEDESGVVQDVEIQPKTSLALDQVVKASRARWPLLSRCEDAAIEAVISMWPEVHINRSSIFEATVSLFDDRAAVLPRIETPSKKVLKGQKKTPPKRKVPEEHQTDLWNW